MPSSSFAQGTRASATTVNPFAAPVSASNGKGNPFSVGLANQSDGINPFSNKDANLSDGGGNHKGKRGRLDLGARGSRGRHSFGKLHQHQADGQQGTLQRSKPNGERPAAKLSNAASNAAKGAAMAPYNAADPLAKKVFETLHQDGISPPSWPSQPGNPESKQAMAKFREQYEAYRERARASLTRAGLIDDPEKRKALSDAIEFKGICEDMCPELEKITRITELDVVQAEKDPQTMVADTTKMVKKLARSAAGQEAPLPMDVRSARALRRSLDYLVDDLLRNDGNLPVLHGFLWDRTRAIRRDFAFFSSLTSDEIQTQVYVLENITRFHVTSLHLLSQEGRAPEDFVEQQELEQLGKALLSLRDLYDDCNEQGIKCGNESEFRAYYLLFHARDPGILHTLQQQWEPRHWRESDEVRTAASLVEALQNTHDFHGPFKEEGMAPSLAASASCLTYFRIVRDPKVSYTMACFAECHFPQLRRTILQTMKRSLTRPKNPAKDITAAALNNFLQFDTIEQAIEFGQLHGLEFSTDPNSPSDVAQKLLVLDPGHSLPQRRLQHQFSENLVERKRSVRPLPDVIHQTVFENPKVTQANGIIKGEESLFIQDDGSKTAQPMASKTGPGASENATMPSLFGRPDIDAAVKVSGSQQGSNATAIFGAANRQQQLPAPNNPFAPSTQSQAQTISHPSSSIKAQHNPFATSGYGRLGSQGTNPFAPTVVAPNSSVASTVDVKSNQSPVESSGSGQAQAQARTRLPPASNSALSSSDGDAAKSSPFPSLGFLKPSQPSKPTPASLSMPPPPIPQPKAPPTESQKTSSSSSAFATKPPPPNLGSAGAPSPFQPAFVPSGSTGANTTGIALTPTASPVTAMPSPLFDRQATTKVMPRTTSSTAFPIPSATAPVSSAVGPHSIEPQMSSTTTVIPNLSQPAAETSQYTQSGLSRTAQIGALGSDASVIPAVVPSPPRDLMGDFAKWFVLGDNGVLQQFEVFIIDNLIRETFDKHQRDVKERKRREDEERTNQEVEKFRTYNLSLKYFYRWKQNARRQRLSLLRRSGRDQLRAFYASRHAADLKAQKEAIKKAAKQRAEVASVNRPEELFDVIKRRSLSRSEAREALLSSGVLSGVQNERDAIKSIVQDEFSSRTGSVASGYQSRDSSPTTGKKVGAKTRALRDFYLGKPEGFRRSLPALSSRESGPSDDDQPRSNASARWTLKAMGIEQLIDGTAVPESIAYDMRTRPGRYSSRAFAASSSVNVVRRASLSGSDHRIEQTAKHPSEDSSAPNKRKRSFDTAKDVSTWQETSERSKHKRIMSEAEKLTSELKAIRKDLEEGTEWFRSQNERLRSESFVTTTDLYEDSIGNGV